MIPLLKAADLCFSYPQEKQLFQNINFSLYAGEILTILGPNGIGKSTLLKCLCGLLYPASGKISLLEQPLSKISIHEIAQKIAYVPQISVPHCSLSVTDYLAIGKTTALAWFEVPATADYQAAATMLERLQLTALAQKRVDQLSGGQLQLVTIAQALMKNPAIIIFDEPTSALDIDKQQKILHLVKKLALNGKAVILTTHNPNHALELQSKTGLFFKNKKFKFGTWQKILTKDNLEHAYATHLKLFYEPHLQRMLCEPASN